MRIYVDGKEAVLKEGSSFEYVRENPLFTEAEGYSLEIEFPLKDQPENILIFGALHVQGVDIIGSTLPCEIDTGILRKTGILAVTSVSEVEIKCQFLEGTSMQNYLNGLPDSYICDLDYSAYDGTGGAASVEAVNGSGWTDVTVYDKEADGWLTSRHVYLWKLIDMVFDIIGWTVDKSVLMGIPMFPYIVVANVRKHNAGQFRRLGYSLPVWTVKEFLSNISLFFGCTFSVDAQAKKVAFVALRDLQDTLGPELEIHPVDSFTVDVGSGEETAYRGNRKFKLPDVCNPDGRNVCGWAVDGSASISGTAVTLDEFVENAMYGLDGPQYDGDTATHSKGNDPTLLYHVWRDNVAIGFAIVTGSESIYEEGHESEPPEYVWQTFDMINQYGGDTEGEELKIAPCDLQSVRVVYDDRRAPIMDIPEDLEQKFGVDGAVKDIIAAGQKKVEDSYYKYIWMVIKKGNAAGNTNAGRDLNTRKWEPVSTMRGLTFEDFRVCHKDFDEHDYTLSPNCEDVRRINPLPPVDETKLYRYNFLGTDIPDVRRIFRINGQRFACLRITAHFTTQGMSELLEGEFYRIID